MKKLVTVLALSGFTAISFAQGLINWANTSASLITAGGGLMLPNTNVANRIYFALFIAPAGTPAPLWGLPGFDDPYWQFAVAYTVNSSAPSGAGRIVNPGPAIVPGIAPGSTVNFIVRAWQSTTGGADWAAAKAGIYHYGQSGLGTATLGGGAMPTPDAFGIGAGQIGGFFIWIPEPSSMALTTVCAITWLIRRRRWPHLRVPSPDC